MSSSRTTLYLPLGITAAGFAVAAAVGNLWVTASIGVITLVELWLILSRRIFRPMHHLKRLAERCLDSDDPLPRLEPAAAGDLADVVRAFNRLSGRVTELKVDVVDAGRELEWTQEELALKETLERKNRIIEETNLQLESRIRELSLLFSASRLFSSSLRLGEVLTNLCKMVGQTLSIDRFVVYLREPDGEAFTIRGTHGIEGETGDLAQATLEENEILRTVFRERRAIYIRDLTQDPRSQFLHERFSLEGSLLAIPVVAAQEVIGVMYFNRPTVDAFHIDELSLLQVISNIAAIAIRNASLYEITEELAVQDPLTGLHNRRSLIQQLESEWERSRRFDFPLSVIMIDVDHFKKFNDEHGHSVGDLVLKATADGLSDELRKVDTLGRFGGEEFLAVLPRTGLDQAQAVAEKLRQRVADQLHPRPGDDGEPLRITLSAGVACSTQESPSHTALLDMADYALLGAKQAGRNRVAVFDRAIHAPPDSAARDCP
ncbi:MAG: diguanylate cyclase [Pseudomonadota bacterium]